MSGFADSFWSDDLGTGLTKLFSKLNQGIVENEELLNLTRRRAESEEAHGSRMLQMAREAYRKDGFNRDDGASLRRAFEGMVKETEESAKCHIKIASNLQFMVLKPFGRWTQEHAIRVQTSEKELMGKVKEHDKQAAVVKKLRSTYFNKCRLLEDLEEEDKLAFPGPHGNGTPTKSPKKTPEEIAADINSVLDDEPMELGDVVYSSTQLKVLLETLLSSIVMKEVKLPILGTFEHVSTGSAVVQAIQAATGASSLGVAETIGQDMLNNGLIRYLGVGNTFANSSVLNYQWKDRALVAAGVIKAGSGGIASRAAAMPYVGEYVATYVSNEYTNETPGQKLGRESNQASEAYRIGVRRLDSFRTDAESTIMAHLQFMERCELDRLKALKAVMMDISAAISNVIPGMKSSMDTMLLFQESVSPLGDLKYMIESYRSGNFRPKVVIYEDYYNGVDDQTYGVDLELRARQDRKRVPNIISAILSYMDEHYPDLASDEARQKVWLTDVPLQLTHQLRAQVNDGKQVRKQVLEEFDIAIVAAALKLYLRELPDSLVSKSLYEPLKSIYSNYGTTDDQADRISAVSSILQQLRVSNIATLDAIAIHFGRLLDLTNADAGYRMSLAGVLGQCLLKPRSESSLTYQDKHPARLVSDLIDYRKEIFQALKRASTTRPRSSTDESDRRVRSEERSRAISNASNPSKRSHMPASTLPNSGLRHETFPSTQAPEDKLEDIPLDRNSVTSDKISRGSLQDEPFQPPEDLDVRRLSLMQANDVERVAVQQPKDANVPVKQPSLSRSVASAHRLSRHGRQESRSYIGSTSQNSQSLEQVDTPRHNDTARSESLTEAISQSPVRGVVLKDGDVDYD